MGRAPASKWRQANSWRPMVSSGARPARDTLQKYTTMLARYRSPARQESKRERGGPAGALRGHDSGPSDGSTDRSASGSPSFSAFCAGQLGNPASKGACGPQIAAYAPRWSGESRIQLQGGAGWQCSPTMGSICSQAARPALKSLSVVEDTLTEHRPVAPVSASLVAGPEAAAAAAIAESAATASWSAVNLLWLEWAVSANSDRHGGMRAERPITAPARDLWKKGTQAALPAPAPTGHQLRPPAPPTGQIHPRAVDTGDPRVRGPPRKPP